MTTAPANQISENDKINTEPWKILLPYGLALLAQFPMLILYFRRLWHLPHYQPFAIAILATIGIALYRWPFDKEQPFRRSLASDFLLVLGLCFAFMGMLFVEPWFAALSAMLIVTSLFARTIDREIQTSLWPCALPLFVYLTLPFNSDVRLITTLQRYSAIYTSRLLDLFGLGHHMDGTVIKVPGLKEYGIEQACSGVQSFFTLMLVAVVFIVMSRRLKVPNAAAGLASFIGAIVCFILATTILDLPGWREFFILSAVGFLFTTVFGFRAAALILSAVFWAVFMNTLRILLIPIADSMFGMDLSHGMSHDLLGYGALALGILMLFSTDQFLLFLFGPVEITSGESGPFGRVITRFWNSALSGTEDEEGNRRRKKRRNDGTISKAGRTLIWAIAGIMIAMGLWQFVDVQRSLARSDLQVRFFDADVTMEYERDDIPDVINGPMQQGNEWKRVHFETQDRSIGSDLGERSDVWQFRSNSCAAVASLDQTFPGWHELTTCYKNQGWKLVENGRKKVRPVDILGPAGADNKWTYIEAKLEKKTGEKGYLLFSHFDAFGNGVDAPENWSTFNSIMIRARNRMSHRIRASLFRGEVYQAQVFLSSFNELSPDVKQEVNERYLKIRDELRGRFIEKKKLEESDAS